MVVSNPNGDEDTHPHGSPDRIRDKKSPIQ